MLGDWNLEPMPAAYQFGCADGGPIVGVYAGVVALPCARESDVAEIALRDHDGERRAAIRNVVPHEAARLRHVHRLRQYERGDIPDLAVRVFAQFDVLDDSVQRIVRVQLTKRPAGNLLVRDGLAGPRGERLRVVDHDLRDAGIRRRPRQERGGDGNACQGRSMRQIG